MRSLICGATLIAAVIAAVVVLAACDGDEDHSPEETARIFVKAANSGDGERACSTTTAQFQRGFVLRNFSCVDLFSRGDAYGPEGEAVAIRSVEEREDTATVRVALTKRRTLLVELARENGWKVADIGEELEIRPGDEPPSEQPVSGP